jgi:hypothetical protein
MRNWFAGVAKATLVAALLLVAAYLVPGLLDGAALANAMLKQSYKLPEIMDAFIPDLVQNVRLSLLAGVGSALVGFYVWAVATAAVRPTGPGQVRRGWRPVLWFVLLAVVCVSGYLLTSFGLAAEADAVDETVATRAAFVISVSSAVVYWALCLIGTERMTRPAIPAGPLLMRAA